MEARFDDALSAEPAPTAGDGLIVACSGGSDSSALAVLAAGVARRERWNCRLVHFDHGLRADSAKEAELVSELADHQGCEFIGEKLPLRQALDDEGGNLEGVARRLRYDALDRLAREHRCAWVLTGHTADDAAETLWLWLLRGTGLRGLSPLPGRRPLAPGSPATLLRPLLRFRRAELQAYLRERGVAWIEDPSNQDLSLRRNRIRHRLLPRLREDFGLDPVPAAARLARQAGELSRFLDSELSARGFPVLDVLDDSPALDRAKLRQLPPVLAAWFLSAELSKRGEATEEAVEKVLAMNREEATGKLLDLPGGIRARFTDQALLLEGRGEEHAPPVDLPQAELPAKGLKLPDSGEVYLSGGWLLRVTRREAPLAIAGGEMSACFDIAALSFPLLLKNVAAGLRIRPLKGPGSRKLSDLFIDRKIPRPFRERVPVLMDAEGRVLWVLGVARGDPAPITERSIEGLCLDLERSSS